MIAWKKFAIILGYWIAMTQQLILLLTFLVAYFSPPKNVLITINDYNEANLELVVLVFVMLFSVGGFIFLLSYLKSDRN